MRSRFAASRPNLWLVHQVAKEYGQRPCTLLGVDPADEPWLAFNLDAGCWMFGTWIDGKLAERTEPKKTGKDKGKTEPKYTLAQLLADPDAPRTPQTRRPFRSVRALRPGLGAAPK